MTGEIHIARFESQLSFKSCYLNLRTNTALGAELRKQLGPALPEDVAGLFFQSEPPRLDDFLAITPRLVRVVEGSTTYDVHYKDIAAVKFAGPGPNTDTILCDRVICHLHSGEEVTIPARRGLGKVPSAKALWVFLCRAITEAQSDVITSTKRQALRDNA